MSVIVGASDAWLNQISAPTIRFCLLHGGCLLFGPGCRGGLQRPLTEIGIRILVQRNKCTHVRSDPQAWMDPICTSQVCPCGGFLLLFF